MTAIHLRFLRVAVIYLIVGMCLGLGMGISEDHRLFPAHAHIGLVGWASFAVYGLVYRSFPSAAASRLARWHFWLANAGALLLVVGVAGINLGNEEFVPLAAAGGVISVVGALVFGTILFRANAAATAG